MEMRKVDHGLAEVVGKKLPDNFTSFMTEISAKEGKAYRVSSFTGAEKQYRCAVAKRADGWYAKCECTGWSRTKTSDGMKKPCKHVAAALLCQPNFDPYEQFEDVAPIGDTPLKEHIQELKEQKQRELEEENPFSDKPLAEEVPAAVPEVHAELITEQARRAPVLVKPVASIQDTRKVFQAFQQAKFGLLDEADIQKVYDGNFIKKSGWRKIAVFFGLSLQKLDEREIERDGERIYAVTYRAIAPGGQFQDATGYCSWNEAGPAKRAAKSKEQKAKLEHDVRATAETRAKNRAISDLVGGGEVSAEEMKMIGRWKDDE